MIRICAMHDDKNVNRAVAGFSGYSVILEKMCFKSLSECRSRVNVVDVKVETVPD